MHSADDWEEVLLPEIERQQQQGKEVAVRADAAFAKPEIYEALEERDVMYAIRIPANENLEWDIAELLPRPVGRPSIRPLVEYKSFLYQAASWGKARRVVAKVEHHQGELFPRVGFIVTNLSLPSRAVVRFYNKRGTVEQWIKDGKQATNWTRLSCHRFRANEVRLQLSVLAYNLGNLWRRRVLPKRIDHWSLTSLQKRLVKTGGRIGETCLVPLASVGRGTSDAAGVRGDAAADLGAAGAGGVVKSGGSRESVRKEAPDGEVSEKWPREEPVRVRPPTPAGQNWWFWGGSGSQGESRLSTVHPEAVGCILQPSGNPKWKSLLRCSIYSDVSKWRLSTV